MLSSCNFSRKQEDICGFGVPALKRVGVAWVKNFRDIKSYLAARGQGWTLGLLAQNSKLKFPQGIAAAT